jgi:hypothetical protein
MFWVLIPELQHEIYAVYSLGSISCFVEANTMVFSPAACFLNSMGSLGFLDHSKDIIDLHPSFSLWKSSISLVLCKHKTSKMKQQLTIGGNRWLAATHTFTSYSISTAQRKQTHASTSSTIWIRRTFSGLSPN